MRVGKQFWEGWSASRGRGGTVLPLPVCRIAVLTHNCRRHRISLYSPFGGLLPRTSACEAVREGGGTPLVVSHLRWASSEWRNSQHWGSLFTTGLSGTPNSKRLAIFWFSSQQSDTEAFFVKFGTEPHWNLYASEHKTLSQGIPWWFSG